MSKKFKVLEFHKKKKLVEYVNEHADQLEIVTISSTQVGIEYRHFLWCYEK